MFDIFKVDDSYLGRLLFSLGALIITILVSGFFKKTLDLIFGGLHQRVSNVSILARTRTIRSLLKNLIDAILLLIALLIILSSWGVNIIPILTGAGVLGLAFSFGAQSLVKDIIAGFFIILEDQFDVGDRVQITKLEGEVYKMTLRITVLKDNKGNLIYIPNSQITTVTKLKNV